MTLERQGASERYLTQAILGRNLRLKRRRVPEDVSDDPIVHDERASPPEWEPLTHLGNVDTWREVRIYLTCTLVGVESERQARAEKILHMVEAIGCRDVMIAWQEISVQDTINLKTLTTDPERISRFIERTEVRSFKSKALLRIGKLIFTWMILKNIEKKRNLSHYSKGPPNGKGQVLYQVFDDFVKEAYPGLQEGEERKAKHRKYREWWYESQTWVRMSNVFGCAILLLIPDGHCNKNGRSISNKQ